MVDKQKVEQAIRLLLEGIGEDTEREGLKDTPDRIARMCMEIYGGLDEEADHHLAKQFEVENNEMVLEKDITFYSMCEHHLMPFYGSVAVIYFFFADSHRFFRQCGSLHINIYFGLMIYVLITGNGILRSFKLTIGGTKY